MIPSRLCDAALKLGVMIEVRDDIPPMVPVKPGRIDVVIEALPERKRQTFPRPPRFLNKGRRR